MRNIAVTAAGIVVYCFAVWGVTKLGVLFHDAVLIKIPFALLCNAAAFITFTIMLIVAHWLCAMLTAIFTTTPKALMTFYEIEIGVNICVAIAFTTYYGFYGQYVFAVALASVYIVRAAVDLAGKKHSDEPKGRDVGIEEYLAIFAGRLDWIETKLIQDGELMRKMKFDEIDIQVFFSEFRLSSVYLFETYLLDIAKQKQEGFALREITNVLCGNFLKGEIRRAANKLNKNEYEVREYTEDMFDKYNEFYDETESSFLRIAGCITESSGLSGDPIQNLFRGRVLEEMLYDSIRLYKDIFDSTIKVEQCEDQIMFTLKNLAN
jgi:hypothetical protein